MKKNLKLVLAASALAALVHTGCSKDDSKGAVKEIEVAGLFSLTGNWSSLGINSKAAIELAAKDINAHFEKTGVQYRIKTSVYDTKLDTALAIEYIEDAHKKNIDFVVGPQSSAEIASIKKFADDNNIIVVSQGSTAGSLAIEGDNIFRFCPSDAIEGAALANSLYAAGKRALVTMARDDAGNRGLQQAVTKTFQELGGTVLTINPYPLTISDFTAVVAEAKTKAETLIASHGAEAVGIYLASFDECVGLFKAAAAHPVLAGLNWYGGDGVALSAAIIADEDAAAFAATTHFFAPAFGLPADARSKWEPLSARITQITGIVPDAFALAAYDAVWVWALNVSGLGDYSQSEFEEVKTNFILQANSYFGTTGATLLNDAGDRGIGSFDYWGIVAEEETYSWKLVGRSN